MREAIPASDLGTDRTPVQRELGALLLAQHTIDELLQSIVSSIGSYLETYGASVTVRRGNHFDTLNASSVLVRDLDGAQYETNDGPSVMAATTGEEVNAGLDHALSTWPTLGEVMQRRDVGGVVSRPLFVHGHPEGTLNVYMDTGGPAEEPLARLVRGFACQASTLLGKAFDLESRHPPLSPLLDALETQDTVGRATGILMVQRACTAGDALKTLTLTSQRANRRLSEIADAVVKTVEAQAGGQAP
jgi:ANTAR domain